MRIELNEAEVARAIQAYVASKTVGGTHQYELTVRIRWRGRSAVVDVSPVVPTLRDEVKT